MGDSDEDEGDDDAGCSVAWVMGELAMAMAMVYFYR